MYADDTCLVYNGDNLQNLETHINLRLTQILDYSTINLGANHIQRENGFKYLGIDLDEPLKYHKHVEHLQVGLSRLCGVFFID